MKKKAFFNGCTVALFLVVLITFLGCPTDDPGSNNSPGNNSQAPVYSIELDFASYAYYGPTGSEFLAPRPGMVTVTNTGNRDTGNINLKLIYDSPPPAIAPIAIDGSWALESSIPNIPAGRSAKFGVYFSPFDIEEVQTYTAKVQIGNEKIPNKEIPVTYGTFLGTNAALNISGDGPLYVGDTGRKVTLGGGTAFSGNTAVVEVAVDGTLTLKSPGKVFIGSKSGDNVTGMWIDVYIKSLSANKKQPTRLQPSHKLQ